MTQLTSMKGPRPLAQLGRMRSRLLPPAGLAKVVWLAVWGLPLLAGCGDETPGSADGETAGSPSGVAGNLGTAGSSSSAGNPSTAGTTSGAATAGGSSAAGASHGAARPGGAPARGGGG